MATKMPVRVGSRGLGTEIIKGAVAGAVATWAMGAVTGFLYEQADSSTRRQEKRARRGRTPSGAAAEKVVTLFGGTLDREERERLGRVIHWTLGIGAGALYAGLRDRFRREDGSRGVALGAAFWGLVDEGLNPALGLTPGPDRFPWQAHARGLAGHLSYGVMVDGTLRVLDRVV